MSIEDALKAEFQAGFAAGARWATSGDRRTLEEVIDAYTAATCGAENFNGAVLQGFIDRFPEHSEGLRRYAVVQLTSRPATREEVEAEAHKLPDGYALLNKHGEVVEFQSRVRLAPFTCDIYVDTPCAWDEGDVAKADRDNANGAPHRAVELFIGGAS